MLHVAIWISLTQVFPNATEEASYLIRLTVPLCAVSPQEAVEVGLLVLPVGVPVPPVVPPVPPAPEAICVCDSAMAFPVSALMVSAIDVWEDELLEETIALETDFATFVKITIFCSGVSSVLEDAVVFAASTIAAFISAELSVEK